MLMLILMGAVSKGMACPIEAGYGGPRDDNFEFDVEQRDV